MGACFCKELHLSMAVFRGDAEEGQPPPGQNDANPPNGSMTDKISRYDIGELATSSLLGLVATIKDHITKPTAMAQGRVAHLIEWKGWGGGGGEAWPAGRAGEGRNGLGAELQDHELLYSQMSDEVKEARFAAGVAAQFALAEAAMNDWSMDQMDLPSASWEATQSHYLSLYLGGGRGGHRVRTAVQASPVSCPTDTPPPAGLRPTPTPPPPSCAASVATAQTHSEGTGWSEAGRRLRGSDGSSLSEDEVFYN